MSLLILFIGAFCYWINKPVTLTIYADKAPVTSLTTAPSPSPSPLTIQGYITQVFGKDAPKAFLVLQGNGKGSCAENRLLDPTEKNDNTSWGGVGVDRGYWQFSSVYHSEVSDWCAGDIKCSTDRAFQIFKQDGNFHQWTCGKVYSV